MKKKKKIKNSKPTASAYPPPQSTANHHKQTYKATITAKPPSHKPTITDPETRQNPDAAINQEL
jgi:hypothetical protein